MNLETHLLTGITDLIIQVDRKLDKLMQSKPVKASTPKLNSRARILGFINAEPESVSLYEIIKKTGLSKNVVKSQCSRLVKAGKIKRLAQSTYGRV